MYKNIISGSLEFPPEAAEQPHISDLLTKLMCMNPNKRLGSLKGGANDLKRHKWFKPTDWKRLEVEDVEPPIIPQLSGPDDLSYFESFDVSNEAVEPFDPASSTGWDADW